MDAMTISQPLTQQEWVRLVSYWSTTSSGLALTPDQEADCDALAKRIKIPRMIMPTKPGTLPPAVPIASPLSDGKSIA
jgi:hypothetical protein